MFAPSRYLRWAIRFYGQVRFDWRRAVPRASRASWAAPGQRWRRSTGALWSILCAAVARHNDVAVAEALPALGTTHALWLACAALLAPGDDVLVEEPAYEALLRIAEGCGGRLVRFTRDARDGFALDPERIVAAMTPRTRLVIVTNLHNPSGVRARGAVLREVARAVEARGAVVLVDEVYAEFEALGAPDGVFRESARKLGPNVVAVSSLTKCFGLGAERVGWVLGPPDVIGRASDALLRERRAPPAVARARGPHRLREAPGARRGSRELLGDKRERVAAWLASKRLPWSAPAEGLFGFVTVPGAGDLTPVIEAAVTERQVIVAPGAFFGAPDGFRIAWSLPADRLDEALESAGRGARRVRLVTRRSRAPGRSRSRTRAASGSRRGPRPRR